MKLTTAQHAQLELVKKAADKLRDAKATAHARFKLLVEQETAANQHEVDRQVRLAAEAGIPKSQIGWLGLGTKSPNPVYESLRRTEPLAEQIAESKPKHIERFTWADDGHTQIRVDMAGADWESARKEMAAKLRKHHDETSGTYRLVDGQIVPRVDMYDRTGPNQYDHPVTAWLLYFGGIDQATEWIAGQTEGIAA